jgi:hypothetical protein
VKKIDGMNIRGIRVEVVLDVSLSAFSPSADGTSLRADSARSVGWPPPCAPSINSTEGADALQLTTTGPTTTLERCTKHFAW